MKNKISKKQYIVWKNLLRKVPVSINNYYGDPLIQWDNTVNKLEELSKAQHIGPIGIITKGKITKFHAKVLLNYVKKGLKIIVFISISELPQFEKVGMAHRYENISILNKYNINNVAYIRPMTPPYNTNKKIINKICKKLYQVRAKTMVVSGFRGDSNIIKDMNPKQILEWTLRVKLLTKDVYNQFKENCKKYNIQLFTRTSCATSCLLKDKYTYNPYYNSPDLVKCYDLECPIIKTCKSPDKPKYGSLSFLKFLGFKVKFIKENKINKCQVKPYNRLGCPSCCTTCYMLKNTRIEFFGNNNLGNLTFARFVTGIICLKKGVRDTGEKDIAQVSFANFPKINKVQCLNSWWPYASMGKTCFDCKYCIEKYYKTNRKNFGLVPSKLLDLIIKKYKILIV